MDDVTLTTLDPAPDDVALDFSSYLAERYGTSRSSAVERLGRWLSQYEPLRAERIPVADGAQATP